MPKLWTETIEQHRRAVRDASLDAAAALVERGGLRSVTMSRIAAETGIGRATLYKYFPDVDSILLAWHQRQIGEHLRHLAELADQIDDAGERVVRVLEAYALIRHRHHHGQLAGLLHQGGHVAEAQGELRRFVQELLAAAAESGEVRDDVPAEELSTYCIEALGAAGELPAEAAVRRLVTVTLAGLRPPP